MYCSLVRPPLSPQRGCLRGPLPTIRWFGTGPRLGVGAFNTFSD